MIEPCIVRLRELLEAKRTKATMPVQNAQRVTPGGPPILAEIVAFLMSRGKRGATVEDIANTFGTESERTMRKWKAHLKLIRFVEYRESDAGPDGKLRLYLTPRSVQD